MSQEIFGECEDCGVSLPEDKLKFFHWRWLCISCIKKIEEGDTG